MFKIYDGREHFYQWDLDRQLVVDDRSITQVHYCNRTGECSLICECYELDGHWVADVPNILLQDNWRMRVYAYDGNATRYDDCFEIKARTKPDTYVYTETEVMTYERLEAKIDAMQDDIGQVVADYLKENPPVVELDNYYNKEETDNKFALKDEVPSIVGLATEEYVDQKVSSIKIPEQDLTGYATEKYVDDAIAAVELIPGPEGQPGKDGADGKDYILTEADKSDIAELVVAALPVYNGEVV